MSAYPYSVVDLCRSTAAVLDLGIALPASSQDALALALSGCEAAVEKLDTFALPALAENRLLETTDRVKEAKAAGVNPTPQLLQDCSNALYHVVLLIKEYHQ